MQESARTRGVDDELRGDADIAAVPRAVELYLCVGLSQAGQLDFIQIIYPKLLGFADKKVVEVGAIPVRIRYFIVRACGDEELLARDRAEEYRGVVQIVMVEGEASLQPAGEFGMSALPAAPFR